MLLERSASGGHQVVSRAMLAVLEKEAMLETIRFVIEIRVMRGTERVYRMANGTAYARMSASVLTMSEHMIARRIRNGRPSSSTC